MKTPLHILHLEDTLADAALLEATLELEQINCEITVVCGRHDFEAALASPELDIILSDFSMPRFDGLTALEMAQKQRPEVPFIFFSGTIGEELAVEALREGATDYVLKDRMARLPVAIKRALSDVEAKNRRQQDMEQLRDQAALLDLAQDAICVKNMDQSILYWNKSAERMYGWTAKEALGRNINELLFQDDASASLVALKSLMRDGKWQGELQQVTRHKSKIIVESHWTLVRNARGEPKSILVINTDVTERRHIEAHFLRTQRMETIGALAGGIAHDLNNSLAPVLIALGILRDGASGEERTKMVAMAQASVQHSVDMVKQILSFARGMGGEQSAVHIDRLVVEIERLMNGTFPRSIQIQSRLKPGLSPVHGNATQLHQVLLNLCVNARDAMPGGGCLTIEAKEVMLEETNARRPKHKHGSYILLSITDTGHGMAQPLLDKIFDPFFTTKEMGKGTGLGLSTVMGIVKTHGGFVEVSSEAGKGSSFQVYLPVTRMGIERPPGSETETSDFTAKAGYEQACRDESVGRTP